MNLETDYLGLKLAHPIVASASPLSRDLDGIRRLEDAGAAAVVMPSIYEEEIAAEDDAYQALVERGSWTQPEAADGYFPDMTAFRVGGLRRGSRRCSGRRKPAPSRSSPASTARRPRAGQDSRAISKRPAPRPSSSTSTGCRPTRARAAPRWKRARSRP